MEQGGNEKRKRKRKKRGRERKEREKVGEYVMRRKRIQNKERRVKI